MFDVLPACVVCAVPAWKWIDGIIELCAYRHLSLGAKFIPRNTLTILKGACQKFVWLCKINIEWDH